MSGSFVSRSHGLGQLVFHFEWCSKYRYNMFRKEKYLKLCEDILRRVAARHSIGIVEVSVMPDHVHMVVELKPSMSISKAFNLLKGASSYELFREQPKFRLRYPRGHFWSPGKFYRSVGDTDIQTTRNYVKNQKNIHQATLKNFTSHTKGNPAL